MSIEGFNKLFEKYRAGRLTRSEYQRFLEHLQEADLESLLDPLLNQYWENKIVQETGDQEQVGNSIKYNRIENPWNWGVAVSMLFLIGLFFYHGINRSDQKPSELVFQTSFGERLEIKLNDGSTVTLNANSELRWNEDWKDSGTRQTELKGEAFFEVAKQKDYQFMVKTEDVTVEVLGTSFNVDNRQGKTKVYLDEGLVNLKVVDKNFIQPQSPIKEDLASRSIYMKPGEVVLYDPVKREIQKAADQSMITAASWKQNVLNFKEMKFSEVLNLLREIYGQSFECSDSNLLGTPMYLGVPYSDWDAVRKALELSLNIEFEQTATRRYVVKNMKK